MKIEKTVKKSRIQWHPLVLILIAVVSTLIIMPTPVSGCDAVGGSFTVKGAKISCVQTCYIYTHGACVSWVTDVPATSQVFYDVQSHDDICDYTYHTAEDPTLVTDHYMRLTGLYSSTKYYFRVRSVVDCVETVSDEFTFVTLTPSPSGPPPAYYEEIDIFGESSLWPISYDGYLLADVEITSTDGQVTIFIPQGTRCLDSAGHRLTKLTVETVGESPQLPETYILLGGVGYKFGPSGATFNPPFKLTLAYDEKNLPEGVKEETLVIAYYDENAAQWVELESVVDTENNTVSAFVEHFTTFAVIGKVVPPVTPTPAKFSISSLSISPSVVATGETVTIRTLVSNTGEQVGSYTVTLKINGAIEATKEINVSGGLSKEVTFNVSKEVAGTYGVEVNGLTASFRVEKLMPANFALRDLVISPGELLEGEQLAIAVTISNIGEESGNYQVILKINGLVKESKEVFLSPGASQSVSFEISKSAAGSYSVDINGLTGSFIVKAKPVIGKLLNWWLIAEIVGGLAVVGLLVYFFVFRKRSRNSV